MKGFDLDALGWNAYVANDDHDVATWLAHWVELYWPDVMALAEVSTHADVLERVAPLLGYRVLQQRPAPHQPRGDDTGDCALLLAAHVKLRHSWVARMRRRWLVLSHHRWHKPHAYEVAAITVRGQRWRVRASHWPTHGPDGPNARAWRESARRSRRWLRRGLLVPSVDVLDANATHVELAEALFPGCRVFGPGPDVALTRRVAGGTATTLGRGGGDHRAVAYTLVMAIPAAPASRSTGNY